MNLSQSDKLFGALLIAFIIYVTVKGELPQYFGLFKSNNTQSGGGASSPSTGGFGNVISNLGQNLAGQSGSTGDIFTQIFGNATVASASQAALAFFGL